jgi:hypothetical protein
MINSLSIAPSPKRDRGSGPGTWPGIESKGTVISNLPTLTGILALQGWEEVRESAKP